MIYLDTNFLIGALVPGSPLDTRLREWLAGGEQIGISALAWGEFLCGPTTPAQVAIAAQLLPAPEHLTPSQAVKGAELFNATGRRRGTFVDCLIAATAILADARLATQNLSDFNRFEPLGLRVLTV